MNVHLECASVTHVGVVLCTAKYWLISKFVSLIIITVAGLIIHGEYMLLSIMGSATLIIWW